jgi:hypothetical protein
MTEFDLKYKNIFKLIKTILVLKYIGQGGEEGRGDKLPVPFLNMKHYGWYYRLAGNI